jgi:probable DNA metabolism protein
MTVFTFDSTLDGLLTAVFEAFAMKQEPEMLLAEGDPLPLFCEHIYKVYTDEAKAQRVWAGLEKRLSKEALRLISVSWLSEQKELNTPLFRYICKVFKPPLTPPLGKEGSTCGEFPLSSEGRSQGLGIERNFSDPDVLTVTNIARRVLHEQLRMKQFIRFQKAKDGTYLAVVSPDHDVLPIIINHFQDRFNDQPWLIYDAKRHYGYYYSPPSQGGAGGGSAIRISFEDEAAVPFNLENGKLNEDVLSENDRLLQDLWRTYFKAICIKERMNPRKQLNDMPRRYWKYMTEKN